MTRIENTLSVVFTTIRKFPCMMKSFIVQLPLLITPSVYPHNSDGSILLAHILKNPLNFTSITTQISSNVMVKSETQTHISK